ncbi:MAG: mechanosensitive ion channel family protein [Christensenella sp.]|nr:mechanosensitive ion channel family protein [Christensenella sp.]
MGAIAVGFALVFAFGRIALKRIAARHEKMQTLYGEWILSGVKRYVLPSAYFAVFYFSTRILTLDAKLMKVVACVSTMFAVVMGAMVFSSLVAYFFEKLSRGKDESGALAIKWLVRIAKGVIWGLALILFLDNIGVKITSLVTGLGIGGVAIAFAAQSALTDIFCFFTIFFDKPFEIGDFIIAGDHMGTVEHIGVKTTRLRAIGGEQLIVSNTDLTGSRIRNYKTMQQRRVSFTLGITYDTPADKLKEIPNYIREIVEQTEDTTFSRAHFASFGTYCLNIEVVYFVLSGDYDRYMEINQRINLAIKECFEKHGVSFALPTTLVQIAPPAQQ